ncbi:MAG: nucleotidyltransferase domain-containing protein [Nitrospirota bacterium]|nr:nucleotidyltransferase domain-containing protein [Nitrospirota bacterium]
MYQKITQLNVLSLFMDNPYEKYYLREAARLLNMSPMTLKRALELLLKSKLIQKEKTKNQILYSAKMQSPAFRHLKISRSLSWLEDKNLIEFLKKRIPGISSIVLYGSYAKGEDDKKSDIDIMVISPAKKVLLPELDKLLGKEVNLSVFSAAEWSRQAKTSRAFYLDVITEGVVLYGTRPVVE